jgi:hypothetical protein
MRSKDLMKSINCNKVKPLRLKKKSPKSYSRDRCSFGKKIGKGYYGTINEVNCKDIDKNLVIKKQLKTHLKDELKFAEEFSSIKVAPQIYDAFVCGRYAYIIMERLDISLDKYVKKNKNNRGFGSEYLKIYKAIIALHKKAKKNSLYRTDNHLGNYAGNLDRNGKLILKSIKMIDFGYSGYIKKGKDDLIYSDAALVYFFPYKKDFKYEFSKLEDILDMPYKDAKKIIN